jgi:hypothetical protein
MALYDPLVPTGFVDLDTDYANLQNNFQQLDDIFGIDHVKYSVITNTGFHNKVTTPDQVTAPVTVTNPVFYALQINTAVGLLQFSRGANNAVPTPLTHLNSSVSGITISQAATVSVLDLTGVSLAIIKAFAVGVSTVGSQLFTNESVIYWNGTSFNISTYVSASIPLQWISVGNVLTLKNISLATAMNNVYWSLDIIRIQP